MLAGTLYEGSTDMSDHIAIVEDEPAIAENYRASLQKLGFRVSVYNDRSSAEQHCLETMPDLAIIDVGLGPEIEGGFELCRNLRSRSPELPIMFLTARDSELDIISGLRLGADDYLTKDISQAHMQARIFALLRRVQAKRAPVDKEDLIERGPLSLNLQRMTTTWQDKEIDLTVTEFWMTHALAQNFGHVKTREQLMQAANMVVDDNTVTSHIKRIRRKFQEVSPDFDEIKTDYGMGYHWSGR
jgi:two-component system OmpR family response regulator